MILFHLLTTFALSEKYVNVRLTIAPAASPLLHINNINHKLITKNMGNEKVDNDPNSDLVIFESNGACYKLKVNNEYFCYNDDKNEIVQCIDPSKSCFGSFIDDEMVYIQVNKKSLWLKHEDDKIIVVKYMYKSEPFVLEKYDGNNKNSGDGYTDDKDCKDKECGGKIHNPTSLHFEKSVREKVDEMKSNPGLQMKARKISDSLLKSAKATEEKNNEELEEKIKKNAEMLKQLNKETREISMNKNIADAANKEAENIMRSGELKNALNSTYTDPIIKENSKNSAENNSNDPISLKSAISNRMNIMDSIDDYSNDLLHTGIEESLLNYANDPYNIMGGYVDEGIGHHDTHVGNPHNQHLNSHLMGHTGHHMLDQHCDPDYLHDLDHHKDLHHAGNIRHPRMRHHNLPHDHNHHGRHLRSHFGNHI